MNEGTEVSRVDNPFASTALAARGDQAMVAVEQTRAIAEIQAAMTVAQSFKRKPIEAVDRIINACSRITLAEKALYTYARGGTEITGPSIRLAEALAQNWGNIKTSVRELEQRNGVSTVQTIAWDLETGYQSEKVFQVTHWRDTKSGGYALKDSRDIYELVANQGARRLRACILAVIPGDVIEAAIRQCDVTLKTKAEVTPERLQSLLEKFASFGVLQAQIELRIQRRLETMLPAQLLSLGKIFNSLSDGMSVPGDWFEVTPPSDDNVGGKPATGASALKAAANKSKAKPKTDGPGPSAETGGAPQDANGPTASAGAEGPPSESTGKPIVPTAAQWFDRCMAARTIEEVNVLQGFLSEYDPKTRAEYAHVATDRIGVLSDGQLPPA